MSFKRDIELLFEVGTFRHLDRIWKQFLNPDVANNAEHTFRVAWIALTLAKYENVKDHGKILKMALVHDLPESRCGDVHYLSRQYVKRNEDLAVEDMFKDSIHESEFRNIWREYEDRKSIESKIVKDADNLDVEFELRELFKQGHTVGSIWKQQRKKNVYPKLYTQSAGKIWNEVNDSSRRSASSDCPRNLIQVPLYVLCFWLPCARDT